MLWEGRVCRGGRLSERKSPTWTKSREIGFSLPELLAVMAMIAIALAIGIPIVNEQVRIAEVRAAADDLALHLRAARMISVTKHKPITFKINVDPDNEFEYVRIPARTVETDTLKRVFMPDGVRITPS